MKYHQISESGHYNVLNLGVTTRVHVEKFEDGYKFLGTTTGEWHPVETMPDADWRYMTHHLDSLSYGRIGNGLIEEAERIEQIRAESGLIGTEVLAIAEASDLRVGNTVWYSSAVDYPAEIIFIVFSDESDGGQLLQLRILSEFTTPHLLQLRDEVQVYPYFTGDAK